MMKFNFRKIASVLASTAMMSSTIALAAAANFPAPFVQGGNANVGVVYGSTAQATDLVAVSNIQQHLSEELARQTASSGGSVSGGSTTGETVSLFTGGTKIYVNDSLNAVKTVVTKSDLPIALADGSFSGNIDTSFTQTIDIGSNPRVTFEKQPTSSDDPNYGLKLSASTANYIYNATVLFNKAVNLTHADSEGQDITLFGQKFTIAAATDPTNLVLLKTAERLSLTSDDPSAEVTIGEMMYTVELVSASDTAATIKVTDADGKSETKEISENASKKINGVTVAVTNADETNLKLSASIVAGAEKYTLTSGSSVKYGEDESTVKGTQATFTGGTTAMTKLVVSVFAPDSDKDAIKEAGGLIDPFYGSFKLDFAGFNIASDSTAREIFSLSDSGDDKLEVKFANHKGKEASINFAKNWSAGGLLLQRDESGHNISVRENEVIRAGDYVVVGNEDDGYLVKLDSTANESDTGGVSNDRAEFLDVFSGDTYKTTWTADGTGTVTIGGRSYSVLMTGGSGNATEDRIVRVNQPDSSGANVVLWPTIETSKGAKLAFYEPVIIDLDDWDGAGTDVAGFKVPDGDGYTDIAVRFDTGQNWSIGTATVGINMTSNISSVTATVGQLTLNFSVTATQELGAGLYAASGDNLTRISLIAPSGGTPSSGNIVDPALIIFEEKDDNNDYQAMVVTLEQGGTGDDGLGVQDVIRTWGVDHSDWETTMASDSKKTMEADLWGSIITLDTADSDQTTATISYPNEQVYAQFYVGSADSSVVAGTATGGSVKSLGSVLLKDSEVSATSGKNLIVVGGSCVNSVAAELLNVPASTCGDGFMTATGVGSGSFLIETFSRTGGAVATLVAGYTADDTTNAATYLRTKIVDTTVGKKYKGDSATAAELVVE